MPFLCSQGGKFRVGHDLIGQNVGLSRLALFNRQENAVGKVTHIAEIECAFQPNGNFAAHLH